MDKFTVLTGVAAPLPIRNVDTDMIIPKQFLKTIKRTGLGKSLFYEMRYDPATGKEIPDFVLNKPQYRTATILVAGDNFGCGSSREHAPWALLDFGIRCVIATDFADIFYNNCFQNGVLAIRLPQATVDGLLRRIGTAPAPVQMTVDLQSQRLTAPDGETHRFDIDPLRKKALLEGLDAVGVTLTREAEIAAWQARDRARRPWVWS
jgi:3-isopropylmalate/(R)-2-methylmalate dehydratase small subunit